MSKGKEKQQSAFLVVHSSQEFKPLKTLEFLVPNAHPLLVTMCKFGHRFSRFEMPSRVVEMSTVTASKERNFLFRRASTRVSGVNSFDHVHKSSFNNFDNVW